MHKWILMRRGYSCDVFRCDRCDGTAYVDRDKIPENRFYLDNWNNLIEMTSDEVTIMQVLEA